MKNEPVRWINLIIGLLEAVLPVLVAIGVVEMDAATLGTSMTGIVVGGNAVKTKLVRDRVSPAR